MKFRGDRSLWFTLNEYPLAADQRGGTLWSGSLSLEEVCQEQHVILGGCFCGTERWLTSSVKTVRDATLGKEQSRLFAFEFVSPVPLVHLSFVYPSVVS